MNEPLTGALFKIPMGQFLKVEFNCTSRVAIEEQGLRGKKMVQIVLRTVSDGTEGTEVQGTQWQVRVGEGGKFYQSERGWQRKERDMEEEEKAESRSGQRKYGLTAICR